MSKEDTQRHGTFSSSAIYKLMTLNRKGDGFGAPAETYIRQVRWEIALGRAINKEVTSKATSWGKYIENVAFNKLPTDYILVSNKRLFHPEYNWSGATDLIKEGVTCDCKSPFSLEVFCEKVDILSTGNLDDYMKEFPEDFWQHISNALLLEESGLGPITHFEAIIYMPYLEDIQSIREGVAMIDDMNLQRQLQWLTYADESELPYLIKGGKYKDLNVFQFEIPAHSKAQLKNKVKIANALIC